MRPLLALILLLVLTAAAPARDWRTHAVESEAGWTFGRPGAPLLVEYASFGCPHCGEFAAGAGPAIAERVKAGKLRYAFRPFLIFPHDRAAAVLTRCVPARSRLAFIKAVMASQEQTRARLAAADADEALRQRLSAAEFGGPAAHALVVAEASGLQALAAEHGLSAPAAATCLADERNQLWVTSADLSARVAGISGTPTFVWKEEQLGRDLTPTDLVARLP